MRQLTLDFGTPHTIAVSYASQTFLYRYASEFAAKAAFAMRRGNCHIQEVRHFIDGQLEQVWYNAFGGGYNAN